MSLNVESLDYSSYFNELSIQQTSKFPKLTPNFNLSNIIKRSVSSIIDRVINESYDYVGVINSSNYNNYFIKDTNIRQNSNQKYFYEFINTGSRSSFSLKDWKYLYLPITQEIANKVPQVPKQNKLYLVKDIIKIDREYPVKVYLLDANKFNTINSFTTSVKDFVGTHSYLPYMVSRGNTIILPTNQVLYEYIDSKGYYGIPFNKYYSSLRPSDLQYPTGTPSDEQIYTNDYLQTLVGSTSSSVIYKTVPYNLYFTGYATNLSYSNNITYYLYLKDSTSLFNKVDVPVLIPYLCESSPDISKRVKSFVDAERTKAFNLSLNINLFSHSTQSIEISQISQLSKLKLL